MKSKLLVDSKAEKTWAVIFDSGEEAMSGLLSFAKQQSLTAAHFTAIGAFSRAVLGYFDWDAKEYKRIPVDEQVEVVTLMGDITLRTEVPKCMRMPPWPNVEGRWREATFWRVTYGPPLNLSSPPLPRIWNAVLTP